MNDPGLGADYPVLVTKRNGSYTLRVKELALVTRGRDLGQAYREIVEKKLLICQWVAKIDSLEEVPAARALGISTRFLPDHTGNAPRFILREASGKSSAEGSR